MIAKKPASGHRLTVGTEKWNRHMSFTIVQVDSTRESFGNYTYKIYENGHLIAHYWHDYRGDEHGIEFVNGEHELWPVGRMTDFIEGGGPKPLSLSERAVTYLNQKRPLFELMKEENKENKVEERCEKKNCEWINRGRFGGFIIGIIFGEETKRVRSTFFRKRKM